MSKEYEIAIITVSHDHNLPVSQWPHSPKSLHTRESVTDRILCQAHDKFYSTPLHKGSRALHSSLHLTILSFPIIQNFNSPHSDPHGHEIDCPQHLHSTSSFSLSKFQHVHRNRTLTMLTFKFNAGPEQCGISCF